MKKIKSKKCFKKFIIIADIKYLREIMNYLLDNFDKNKISLKLYYDNDEE